MRVGLVVVSHSVQLAAGVVELASQMAPDVVLVAAGGMDDGGLGTSLEKVMAALGQADSGSGAVVLTDLGSAVMIAESALEFLEGAGNFRLADAPLVEGAVAAAVAAQAGASLGDVCLAAENALQRGKPQADAMQPNTTQPDTAAGGTPVPGAASATVTLVNPLGLHARPAATLASALGTMDVDIEVNGVDGQSVMMLMTLGAGAGTELTVTATGPDAGQAVDFVRSEVERGFGEI